MSLFTRNGPSVDGDAADPDDATWSQDDEKTVRLVRKRFARRQWTRRWLAWRKVLVACSCWRCSSAPAGWCSSPRSSPSTGCRSRARGCSRPTRTSCRRGAPGGALATTDLDAITARVERLPAVRSVDVSRAGPTRCASTSPSAARSPSSSRSRAGRRAPWTPKACCSGSFARPPRGLPMIRMGDGVGADALTEAAQVAGSLPPALARKVAFVEVQTVDTISLVLHSGRMVRWGSADGSADKARVLAVLLAPEGLGLRRTRPRPADHQAVVASTCRLPA